MMGRKLYTIPYCISKMICSLLPYPYRETSGQEYMNFMAMQHEGMLFNRNNNKKKKEKNNDVGVSVGGNTHYPKDTD